MRSNQVYSSGSLRNWLNAPIIVAFTIGIALGLALSFIGRPDVAQLRKTNQAQAIALTAASINSERAAKELREAIELEEASRVTLGRIGEGLSGIGNDLRAAAAEDVTIAELLDGLAAIADGIDKLERDLAETNQQFTERNIAQQFNLGREWYPRRNNRGRSCSLDFSYRFVRSI